MHPTRMSASQVLSASVSPLRRVRFAGNRSPPMVGDSGGFAARATRLDDLQVCARPNGISRSGTLMPSPAGRVRLSQPATARAVDLLQQREECRRADLGTAYGDPQRQREDLFQLIAVATQHPPPRRSVPLLRELDVSAVGPPCSLQRLRAHSRPTCLVCFQPGASPAPGHGESVLSPTGWVLGQASKGVALSGADLTAGRVPRDEKVLQNGTNKQCGGLSGPCQGPDLS
jgi:hypothetical protein